MEALYEGLGMLAMLLGIAAIAWVVQRADRGRDD